MKRALTLATIVLTACTPGGVTPVQSAGASAPSVVTVDVSLSAFALQQLVPGPALGFSPEVTTVSVGTGIQFRNVDNTAHTASFVGGTTFPNSSPLQFSATSPSANTTISSGNWSSGSLQPGVTSQIFLVDKPGMYLYGCFYHYGGMMRAEIIAQ